MTASEIIEMSNYLEDAKTLRDLLKIREERKWICLSEMSKNGHPLLSDFAERELDEFIKNLLGEIEDIIAGSEFKKYDNANKNVV